MTDFSYVTTPTYNSIEDYTSLPNIGHALKGWSGQLQFIEISACRNDRTPEQQLQEIEHAKIASMQEGKFGATERVRITIDDTIIVRDKEGTSTRETRSTSTVTPEVILAAVIQQPSVEPAAIEPEQSADTPRYRLAAPAQVVLSIAILLPLLLREHTSETTTISTESYVPALTTEFLLTPEDYCRVGAEAYVNGYRRGFRDGLNGALVSNGLELDEEQDFGKHFSEAKDDIEEGEDGFDEEEYDFEKDADEDVEDEEDDFDNEEDDVDEAPHGNDVDYD